MKKTLALGYLDKTLKEAEKLICNKAISDQQFQDFLLNKTKAILAIEYLTTKRL